MPLPDDPVRVMFRPEVRNNGMHRSTARSLPPTMYDMVLPFAPGSPPLTGASTTSIFKAAAAAAIFAIDEGSTVL